MKDDISSAVQAENRRLAAIMFTDIVGFSRQMGRNEARTLRLLDTHNQIIQHAVAEHHGTVIKTVGDAFLVDFPSVVHAVQCAQQIQAQFRTHNADKEPSEQIHVRLGIHLGDIVQRAGDVFGDGVNIASRLQELAEPDTICFSHVVYQEVVQKLGLSMVVALGQPKLKNITQRFPVYVLLSEPPKGLRQVLRVQRLKLSRRLGTVHLSWPVITLAGVLLITGTVLTVRFLSRLPLSPRPSILSPQAQPALPLPNKPSLVVLPFVNMSNAPEQEYFSDGLTEDLTADLSKFSGLFVIARNSAFSYKGKAVKAQEVGEELGVRYVLEGSVRKADAQVRITAQLIDATTGYHMWSGRYDRPLKELFAVQDEIVQQLVANLRVEVMEAEFARVRRVPTENLTAYDFYLRGLQAGVRALTEASKEANEQARQMYEKAVELDPTYAEAYAMLGFTYYNEFFNRWTADPAQALERAFTLAQQAVALDDSLPTPHGVLGFIFLWKKQYEQALAEVKTAMALDPNNPTTHLGLGIVLAFAGQPQEGVEFVEKALRLNPRYPANYLQNLGRAYRLAGRCEEAIAPLKRAIALSPTFIPSRVNLVVCYVELGREEEARAEATEVLRINPNYSLEEAWRHNQPFKDPAVLEHFFAAARRAGLK
jgi:adenylate cyclase